MTCVVLVCFSVCVCVLVCCFIVCCFSAFYVVCVCVCVFSQRRAFPTKVRAPPERCYFKGDHDLCDDDDARSL